MVILAAVCGGGGERHPDSSGAEGGVLGNVLIVHIHRGEVGELQESGHMT